VDLIIIDYLQLMTAGGDSKGGNREQEISSISRSIKSIAKELDIPIIAFSQLSRAVETRGGDKRPMLSDLRESGAIEQDADIVCFLYRPEYYKIYEDEHGSTLGVGEVIVAKHRNGAVDTVGFVSSLNWPNSPTWRPCPVTVSTLMARDRMASVESFPHHHTAKAA
jgi:replicative DNA helicase